MTFDEMQVLAEHIGFRCATKPEQEAAVKLFPKLVRAVAAAKARDVALHVDHNFDDECPGCLVDSRYSFALKALEE